MVLCYSSPNWLKQVIYNTKNKLKACAVHKQQNTFLQDWIQTKEYMWNTEWLPARGRWMIVGYGNKGEEIGNDS